MDDGTRRPVFECDQLYLEHAGEKTVYSYLARHRHELFRDKDFAELYQGRDAGGVG